MTIERLWPQIRNGEIVRRLIALVASLWTVGLFSPYAFAFGRQDLWDFVSQQCVPGYLKNANPFPCLEIDGDTKTDGVAIFPDIRGRSHFLAIPTTRVGGIESPQVLSDHASRWFEDAWNARRYVFRNLGKDLPDDDIALAINSQPSRTQDQLHIHIDCVRSDVRDALALSRSTIGTEWSPHEINLNGRRYHARLLNQPTLKGVNPFRLVAEGPGRAEPNLGLMTIVVVGTKMDGGQNAFIVLAGHVNRAASDRAHGEDLLDRSCALAK